MGKTNAQLEAENKALRLKMDAAGAAPRSQSALEAENALLKKKLAGKMPAKIMTAKELREKKGGVMLTREERLELDLSQAYEMTPEQIAVYRKNLAEAIDSGLDPRDADDAKQIDGLRFLVALERKLHGAVKRGKRKMRTQDGTGTRMVDIKGGWVKGLPKQKKAEAEYIMHLLDRKDPKWDETIPVPGLERLDIIG